MARPHPEQFPPIRLALAVWGLGAGLYLGQFQGGLYPGGSNQMQATHGYTFQGDLSRGPFKGPFQG